MQHVELWVVFNRLTALSGAKTSKSKLKQITLKNIKSAILNSSDTYE